MIRLALLILIPFGVQAQSLPVTGEIIYDSNFICIDRIQPDSSTIDIKEICNSENYLEIRLKKNGMSTTEMIVLSFNKNEWVAEKYYPEFITKKKKVLSVIMHKKTRTDSGGLFNRIFDSLKLNSLFLLPDQRTLTERLIISDGVLYTVTYKIGDLYRRYWYSGPEANAEYYPKVAEYKKMIQIIRLLNGIFYRQYNANR